ncbi:hemerythrin-like metal-binding protein [Azospirillum agricola]|uniref:bacteriohemerythrin n=1 Tax=Azospirillum agricola TaxID=1720247 RepID=UPI001AE5E9E8|nr:bacteriohemerythrin [Azospirillum agricola]MBP2227653.1 hemerythrin-like metal-binding protein [Azospirillum agricola]
MTGVAALLDSLAQPAAVYGPDGALLHANGAFHALWKRLVPAADRGRSASLGAVTAFLGLPCDGASPGRFHDHASAGGVIAAFALAPLAGGGWTLSAQDVTDQRRDERSAERSQKIALVALADLAEHRDNETGEHVLRVARLTHETARRLWARGDYPGSIDDDLLRHVGVASILHDVGKVSIPDTILLKPGRLTPEERAVMETHAASGAAILRKAETMLAGSVQFRLAASIAECHHERWDGTGYPNGLAGEAIPLAARIVGAADVYDALSSRRPYKEPWPAERVAAHLREQSGRHFDPLVVEALLEVVEARAGARTIEWTAEMETGIPAIDSDHRVLLALVNQIAYEDNKGDRTAVEFVLDELLGYTALHFAREEALLERCGYPDLDHHRRIHAALLDEVRGLQRRMVAFTPGLGEELHRFLGHWLTSHIQGEDMTYLPYVPR